MSIIIEVYLLGLLYHFIYNKEEDREKNLED